GGRVAVVVGRRPRVPGHVLRGERPAARCDRPVRGARRQHGRAQLPPLADHRSLPCPLARSGITVLSTQLTAPTISAPSTAVRKPSTWNGSPSLPAIQLVSRNSAPLTTRAIRPSVST